MNTATLTTINELSVIVNSADTTTLVGRQAVANACKELYNLIEEDVFKADKEWMLSGIYNDLCNGNFAEPFMCEKKKETFSTIVNIYEARVIPCL